MEMTGLLMPVEESCRPSVELAYMYCEWAELPKPIGTLTSLSGFLVSHARATGFAFTLLGSSLTLAQSFFLLHDGLNRFGPQKFMYFNAWPWGVALLGGVASLLE